MLSSLFAHLPAIKAKFSSESQHLIRLFEGLKKDIMVRGVAKDPWALARTVGMMDLGFVGLLAEGCNNVNITGKVFSLKKRFGPVYPVKVRIQISRLQFTKQQHK